MALSRREGGKLVEDRILFEVWRQICLTAQPDKYASPPCTKNPEKKKR